jgi:YD repeat-containing protein
LQSCNPIQAVVNLLQGNPNAAAAAAQAATSPRPGAQFSAAQQAQAILNAQAQATMTGQALALQQAQASAAAQAAAAQAVVAQQGQAAAAVMQAMANQAQAAAAATQAAGAQAQAVLSVQLGSAAGAVAAGSAGGNAVQGLVGAQLGGAAAGAAVGPAVTAAGAIPSLGLVGPWLTGSGVKGVLGSIGGVLPNVGGILFSQSAQPLTSLEEISGVYWDEQAGNAVLIGRPSGSEAFAPVALPALDRDHLAVALRAAVAGLHLGVSIDPPAQYREGIASGRVPPDGTEMFVSYLGHTRGTLFGAIMFEADRLLKCLDKGVDNKTREPRRARVPGFKPLLEMLHPTSGREANIWHRFWFVIDRVELKEDPATKAVSFGDVKIRVLTEVEREGESRGAEVDPFDAAFANHLTDHYDEYAAEFPELAQLRELAKIAALAYYLVKLGVPLDLEGLFSRPPVKVETPDTTPGISVVSPNVEVRQVGSATHTRMVSLFGGVDLFPRVQVRGDDGSARRASQIARGARPSLSARAWRVPKNGKALAAVAVPLAAATSPLRHTCCDLSLLAPSRALALSFSRTYDPSLSDGPFGRGWSAFIPYRISFLPSDGKRAETQTEKDREQDQGKTLDPPLLVHNGATGQCSLYRRVDAEKQPSVVTYCRVTSSETVKNAVSFRYDPSQRVTKVGERWQLVENGKTFHFDPSGQLLAISSQDGSALSYEYERGRLVRTRDNQGRFLELCYAAGAPERVVSAKSSDGQVVSYFYHPTGTLAAVVGSRGMIAAYRYDEQARLAEAFDRLGQVVLRATYDDLGEVARSARDAVSDESGNQVERDLDDRGRLISARDRVGARVEYSYGPHGELSGGRIFDGMGRQWRLSYEAAGRLTEFHEIGGLVVNFHYGGAGLVERASSNRGGAWKLCYDDFGRATQVEDAAGAVWAGRYDKRSYLEEILGPDGSRWRLSYHEDRLGPGRDRSATLRRLAGPGCSVEVVRRAQSLRLRATRFGGWWEETVYDGAGMLLEVASRGAHRLRFAYDSQAELSEVSDNKGAVSYRTSEQDLTVKVVFA